MQLGGTAYTKKWLIVIVLAMLALFVYVYGFNSPSSAISFNSSSPTQQDSALSPALNACDGIAEKAALALPPAKVEFQRLEHAGRKARVFRLCMQDRGYQENPRWAAYAKPLAVQVANASHVSVDEAMENLSRAAMARAQPEEDAPSYWAKR